MQKAMFREGDLDPFTHLLSVMATVSDSDLFMIFNRWRLLDSEKIRQYLSVVVYCLISLSVAVLWHNFAIGGGLAIKLQDPLITLPQFKKVTSGGAMMLFYP